MITLELTCLDKSAGGNEAVLECTQGSYCCDGNRPELSGGTNCCSASQQRFYINGQSAASYSAPNYPAEPSRTVPLSPPEPPIVSVTLTVSEAPSTVIETLTITETPAVIETPTFIESPAGTESYFSTTLASEYASNVEETALIYGNGELASSYETWSSPEMPTSNENLSLTTLVSDNASLDDPFFTSESSQPLSTSNTFAQSTRSTSAASSTEPTFRSRTPAPPSPTSTASRLPTPISAAAPSPSITSEPRFVAGVTVGALFALIFILFAFFVLRRRRQKDDVQYQSTPPRQGGYAQIGQFSPGGHPNARNLPISAPITQQYPPMPVFNGAARIQAPNPSPYSYTATSRFDPGSSRQPTAMQYSSAYRPFNPQVNPQVNPEHHDLQPTWQSPQDVNPFEDRNEQVHHYGPSHGPYRPMTHSQSLNTVSESTGLIASADQSPYDRMSPSDIRLMTAERWRRRSEMPS